MTIDEAIRHCLEVAEKNDGEAEVYGLLAKNHNNPYEKLTASRFHADCAECAADHRQLAEWLMDYKDLKAEQNDQYVFIHELMSELKEAKRLLKLAIEDIYNARRGINCGICDMPKNDIETEKRCEVDNVQPECKYRWRYADEAEKLLNDEK